ncbi:phospholipid-transporting ATPase [Thraustotheca clavata]|uniref:Phospholipid-transporting ATPase n=1 Tax=Thraustotheca clavata TaxID=74557 RepID=A0A1V9Y8G3_9STRA|nr:phospholipid-transporting ATPase [Thraustotheca clavata]
MEPPVVAPSASVLNASHWRLVYFNNPSANTGYVDNSVTTSKYTFYSFLPVFLYERFTRVANFYFLLVGVGQLIPAISSTLGLPYQWMVLSIVLFVDAVFTGLEDLARHKADTTMNARTSLVFDPSTPSTPFVSVPWKDIRVGDIIQVKKYEAVPADILLLAVHEANPSAPVGMCFVETKSLDGETNLKIRQALSCTYAQLSDPLALGRLPGRVYSELPNHDINTYSGRYEPDEKSDTLVPLDLKNVALRGCVIRNTPYVYGLVLNAGTDTKVMQAANKTPTKTSKALEIINRGIFILMAILISLCLLGTILDLTWINAHSPWYLYFDIGTGLSAYEMSFSGGIIIFGYYWILIASFIPITLYVSIAIVKSYQTYFMNRDLGMYYAPSDTPAIVRNADLNDELGQVTHIFSDKTGTLTANEMNFRKMSIAGRTYGRGSTDIGRAAQSRAGRVASITDMEAIHVNKGVPNVQFLDPKGELAKDWLIPQQAANLTKFLTHLAICHSVVIETDDATGSSSYSASSPDELALVAGAAFFGFSFVERSTGKATIRRVIHGAPCVEEFQILELIEFTSTRKRMSVVCRTPSNRLLLMTKGADMIIYPRLSGDVPESLKRQTMAHMEQYAADGLRTLVIAQRTLDEAWYKKWSEEYQHALTLLDDTAPTYADDLAHIEELEEQLECDLELLGATAVEDRLQTGVPETIACLMSAGIKVWVLTGDKEETAINIAFACRLLTDDMDRMILNSEICGTDNVAENLQRVLMDRVKVCRTYEAARGNSNSFQNVKPQAIVIDGQILKVVLNYPLLKFLFLEIAQMCKAVICCRVSPKQKAEVVALVKKNIADCRTLSIGDGANDVSMIQEAHIGIGISGHEGLQAVNASDFAIAQFEYLRRLLLVHGHWNYHRMCKLVLYVVYKNIICYFTVYVFAVYAGGSGTLYVNNYWLNGYNIFWTFLPIMILAIMEQETSASMAYHNPGLYHIGAHGEMLSLRIFTAWIVEGLFEACVCTFVPLCLLGVVDSKGNSISLLNSGGISFCAIIAVGWAKLGLNIVTWNAGMHFAMWATLPFWIFSGYIVSNYLSSSITDHIFPYICTLPEFYLVVFLAIVIALARDFIYKCYKREWYPEYYHVLQEAEKLDVGDKIVWNGPVLPKNYKPFQVDFRCYLTSELKPLPDPTLAIHIVKSPKHPTTHQNYRGFAFSQSSCDDRHRNVLRSIILKPIRTLHNVEHALVRALSPRAAMASELQFWKAVEVMELPHFYEVQRYQVFLGWSAPFSLADPFRYCNRDMSIGACHRPDYFSTDDWIVDISIGVDEGGDGHWEYATKFHDFIKLDIERDNVRLKHRGALKRHLNKIIGRCVRRRRWVLRPEALIARQTTPHEPSHSEQVVLALNESIK